MSDVATLRHQAGLTRAVVRMNTEGVTHDESLRQPQPGGNNINWVLGHLLATYNDVLPLIGETPVLEKSEVARYVRGSAPMVDPKRAMKLDDLQRGWAEACERLDAGLAAFPVERLAGKAPFSPSNDPTETVGTLLSTVLFHQAYHAGQLGVLRRMVGKEGAIK